MPKITPFLWYDGKLDEALKFYTSIFKNSKIINTSPGPDGSLFSATFELEGQQLMLLNGGPMFKLNESFSLFVSVETQEEVDFYWDKLKEGGAESRCGWVKDKYGLWWQIIPTTFMKLIGDKDPAKAGRVMQAMMKMDKMIIADLQKAYDNN